jgi:hypothetical protein
MLKGLFTSMRGAKIKFKISRIISELGWAFQRAWKGHDDLDVSYFKSSFCEKYARILKESRERGFIEPDSLEVVDEIIALFEDYDGTKMDDVLFGGFDEATGRFEKEPTIEEIMDCYEQNRANRRRGLELFSEHFEQLGDC